MHALELARKTPGWAECKCAQRNKPLRLVIRRYGSIYHLAGWPDDGHRHAKACPFFKDGTTTVTRATSPHAAIRQTATGLNTRLDVVFAPAADPTGPTASARPETAGERTSRRSASLLAFLQFLGAKRA
ncbi:DUF1173 family protein [Paraburkholderia aromaticivorans]|uniref:DUF1173 family protein n=1 Tax=Paraburkholderia aromaticivorans TaxID=2026199 RepID=UPI001455EAF8|nr:DUF1173 family protein [Paraburkholderia aromaticivorans]